MYNRVLLLASLLIASSFSPANARPYRVSAPTECNVTMPCDFSGTRERRRAERVFGDGEQRHFGPRSVRLRSAMAMVGTNVGEDRVVGGRPAGCPHSFCGCGASLRVFGRIVPGLNLASNWLRFPRAAPAPGMVAARHGHVFVLEQHLEGDTWMAYDANSGGHATRLHARSLRGYTVVNPHAA